ncbi:MAG: hypothetical protein JJV92_07710 [Desulfosarcina sp.]|nr:hypothetical protein [Desulfobacterales bacterium]
MGVNKELLKLMEDDDDLLRKSQPRIKKKYMDDGYSKEDVDDTYVAVVKELFEDDDPLG